MEELFRSGSIDQNRSSVNWPLAKALQRHGDAETGFNAGPRVFLGLVSFHHPPHPLRSSGSGAILVTWGQRLKVQGM